ncbi:MAG: hypothetical protein J0H60_26800 [Rhizobiales bacterium]|nr:hypothetical protein [Hyphomicrobiales bacterium]
MRIVFVNDDDIGIVELVARHHAVDAVDLEQRGVLNRPRSPRSRRRSGGMLA